MFLVIEYPSNAATIFAGRIIKIGTKDECSKWADFCENSEALEVGRRQREASKIAGTGIAATECSAVAFTVISKSEWDAEFKRRSNR